MVFYIMQYMKQLLIEVDDDVMKRLEQVAPGKARQRSEFIRSAIRRALWELEEHATAEAYGRQPDPPIDVYLDAKAWEPNPNRKKSRR